MSGQQEAITEEELALAIAEHTGWKTEACVKDAADLFRLAASRHDPAAESPDAGLHACLAVQAALYIATEALRQIAALGVNDGQ